VKKTVKFAPLALIWFLAAACNSPAGPDTKIEPAEEPYAVDLSAGGNLWGDTNAVTQNEDGSVTITYMTGKDWPAWGINLYTGAAAGMDLSGYGTVEIVWEAVYPDGTGDQDEEGNPNKQIKFMVLCGGLDPETNKKLEKYNGVETQTTATIDLTPSGDFSAGDKQNVQQLVFQAKIPSASLTIHSITFMPLKNTGASNTFSGSDSFWIDSSVTKETVSYQGKTDVLHVSAASYSWGPVRVDLSDYAEKEVKVDVSMNMWMDTSSKIMWQVNDSGYTVITGGNDSYPLNQWDQFTGSRTVTLPPVDRDENGNITGCPWFYLDNAGLRDNASYYIADFELTISVLE
jgi:hypothetical protein